MKTLIFSDLHANKRSLKDIDQLVPECDRLVCCGDLTGYGKEIDYCVDFVFDHCDIILMGNHDRFLFQDPLPDGLPAVVLDSISYTRDNISSRNLARIAQLPEYVIDGQTVYFHSIDDRYLYEGDTDIILRYYPDLKYYFTGHTHYPFIKWIDNQCIVNVGSITKGRQGQQRAYCLLHDDTPQLVYLSENVL